MHRRRRERWSGRRLATCAALCLAVPCACRYAPAAFGPPIEIPASEREGSAHGFPQLRALDGRVLADGEFTQSVDGDRVHARIVFRSGQGSYTEETTVIRQAPNVVQERWAWREVRDGEVLRRFEIDFLNGKASAEKVEDGKRESWSKDVELEPGRSFAGSGFSMALRSLHDRLLRGEEVELQGVGFLPKPKAGDVAVKYVGLERMEMAGRTLTGEHYVIHPKVPAIARLFVDVPDTHLWLLAPPQQTFLRLEGPLAEPSDPIIRVDLLSGGSSGNAVPIAR